MLQELASQIQVLLMSLLAAVLVWLVSKSLLVSALVWLVSKSLLVSALVRIQQAGSDPLQPSA
jgi:hypothetical protein